MVHTPIKQDKLIDHQPMIQPGNIGQKIYQEKRLV
jgi:hypothetical protein